tara:strand:+ start:1048 stop:1452 length:405 start_codon:yes stop_codon:yes gene_type:complete
MNEVVQKKFLYFHKGDPDADSGADSGSHDDVACFAADRLMYMEARTADKIRLVFDAQSESVLESASLGGQYHHVEIEVLAGKHKEVMQAIVEAINSPGVGGSEYGFIEVAHATAGRFLHPFIEGITLMALLDSD